MPREPRPLRPGRRGEARPSAPLLPIVLALVPALALLPAPILPGLPAGAAASPPPPHLESARSWPFLSTSDIRAAEFTAAHPTWDGRGVLLAILDTGVDMGVEGLRVTPSGEVKVIECRDFSGQGDVSLSEAEVDTAGGGITLLLEGKRVARGVEKLPSRPEDGRWLLGVFEETRLKNSEVPDLNDNGSREDRFAVLAFRRGHNAKGEPDWVAAVDTDGDGEFSTEKVLRSYGVAQETFHFGADFRRDAKTMLTAALFVDGDAKKISLFFDDGAHGTHVAGIAAGWRLNGEARLSGVAPGAKILALKIGDNTLAGGSTRTGSMKKALRFAADWAKEKQVPVVVNMSYGIGSETEGRSAIDRYVNDLLREVPNLAVSMSAGNNGPGLSSVGTPGSAALGLASGALLTVEAGRAQYGAALTADRLFSFSSRGGDLAKPDVVSPGSAASTVPAWTEGDRMSGTSMASPQTAGALALLWSAALQADPPLHVTFPRLKRALRGGARPLPGYDRLDQGAGVVQVDRAWEVLRRIAARPEDPGFVDFEVSTEASSAPGRGAPVAYWRAAGYHPRSPEEQVFQVTPLFTTRTPPDEKERFYRAFDLVTDVDWLRPDRTSFYLKGPEAQRIAARFAADRPAAPGVHVGRILAWRKGAPREPGGEEFELRAVVVVPHTDGTPVAAGPDGAGWTARGDGLGAGEIRRYFVQAPAGASALEARLSVPEGTYGSVRAILFDPEGHAHGEFHGYAESGKGTTNDWTVLGEDLRPGTWEVDVFAGTSNPSPSAYELSVRTSRFVADPLPLASLDALPGSRPAGAVTVTCLDPVPFEGTAEGSLDGYEYATVDSVRGEDVVKIPFRMDGEIASVRFDLALTPGTYARMTDVAANLKDADGRTLVKSGFGDRRISLLLRNPAPDDPKPREYALEVIAAFADGKEKGAAGTGDWAFERRTRYERREKAPIRVTQEERETLRLLPGVPARLLWTFARTPFAAPPGAASVGSLRLLDARERRVRLAIPIRVAR